MLKFKQIHQVLQANTNIVNAIPVQALREYGDFRAYLQKISAREADLLLQGIQGLRTACHDIEQAEIGWRPE